MNYYVFIPLVALIFNVFIIAYVVAQRRTPVNKDYILLSSCFIGWMVFDILNWLPVHVDWIIPLLKLQTAFWLPIGFLLTKFTYTLLGRKKDLTYNAIFIAVVISIPIGVGTDLVINGYDSQNWGALIKGGILYIPFSLLITTAPFVFALVLIFLGMRKTEEKNVRRQMAMIIYGSGFAAVVSISTIIILPEFFDIKPLPLHHFGIIIHLGFIAYAILKYRFLAIGIHDVANDLFSNVRDGVVVLNKYEDVLQANEAAHKLFNEKSSEKVIEAVYELLESRQLLGEEEVNDHEITINKPKGNLHLRLSRFPVKQAGEEIGTIIFLHDVTKHKEAAEKIKTINRDLSAARDQALEASQTKSAFLANVSHELRTPLNAIIGYSEMLLDDDRIRSDAEISNDMQCIYASGNHLLGLINQVLDLSKVEAGHMDVHIEEVNIAELIESVVDTLQPLVEKNQNKLAVECFPDIGQMHTDFTKLRQILFNLLSNSSKFTEQGTIDLDIKAVKKHNNDWIQFSVSDSGIGIAAEHLNKLFDPFTQADSSTTRKFGGTGLGLNITHHFCELLGGNISVTSKVGEGTTFIVQLPRQPLDTSN